MIKAIVVEEKNHSSPSINQILLDHCPQIIVMGEANNTQSALALIQEVKPELVISEINFSDGEIFAVLDSLIPFKFEIVFITDEQQHSVKAFKYNALDYLLKPVNVTELQIAIGKAIKKIWDNRVNDQLAILVNNIRNISQDNHKIAIPTLEGYVFVQVSEILRCEANGAYTSIYLCNKEKILASKNIKEYELLLPKQSFFRVHNSHLVNLNKVVKYTKGRGGTIIMEDGTHIEVASRRKDKFLNMFQ